MGNIVKTWYQTIDTYNNNLFNGSDASIKELYGMITAGKVLEPGFQQNELHLQSTVDLGNKANHTSQILRESLLDLLSEHRHFPAPLECSSE